VSPTDDREIRFADKKISCALVHENVLFRQGLRRLLEDDPEIEVTSEAGNAAEGLRKIHELHPDVLIADVGAFGVPVGEARGAVERESPQSKVVFLDREQTRTEQNPHVENCVGPETSADDLVEMVRMLCGRDEAGRIRPSSEGPRAVPAYPQERTLTAREREVLKFLAEGKTVRETAALLGLSSKTVDAHKFNLMRKLGIHNKAELVMWAVRKRVVKVPVNF
jgi:DNA-binding NarL/FixJ family response regulator